MRADRDRPHQDQGFTLVELMVAMAVGLFLTAGILQLFMSSSRSYAAVDASARIQENARYGVGALTRDIRMAGFMGCRSLYEEGVVVSTAHADTFDEPEEHNLVGALFGVVGYESGSANAGIAAAWDTFFSSEDIHWVPGTDVVQVLFANGQGAMLDSDMTAPAEALDLDRDSELGTNDLAVITDCGSTSLFTMANQEEERGSHQGLDRAYRSGARVFPLVARAYFIGTGGAGCTETPCLYRRDLAYRDSAGRRGWTDPLVIGVEDLQLSYGEDTDADGSVDVYRTASEVADWGRVTSVRMGLLFASDAPVTSQPQTYLFEDPAEVDPAPTVATDRRLRASYWVTASLRNALP